MFLGSSLVAPKKGNADLHSQGLAFLIEHTQALRYSGAAYFTTLQLGLEIRQTTYIPLSGVEMGSTSPSDRRSRGRNTTLGIRA